MDLAREIQVELETGDYPAEALRTADEAFISSTAGGVMPVTKVDGKMLGDGKPGPISWRLHELYWTKREAGWLGTRVTELVEHGKGRENVRREACDISLFHLPFLLLRIRLLLRRGVGESRQRATSLVDLHEHRKGREVATEAAGVVELRHETEVGHGWRITKAKIAVLQNGHHHLL